jgi:hypothetical protein
MFSSVDGIYILGITRYASVVSSLIDVRQPFKYQQCSSGSHGSEGGYWDASEVRCGRRGRSVCITFRFGLIVRRRLYELSSGKSIPKGPSQRTSRQYSTRWASLLSVHCLCLVRPLKQTMSRPLHSRWDKIRNILVVINEIVCPC